MIYSFYLMKIIFVCISKLFIFSYFVILNSRQMKMMINYFFIMNLIIIIIYCTLKKFMYENHELLFGLMKLAFF